MLQNGTRIVFGISNSIYTEPNIFYNHMTSLVNTSEN